MKYFIYFLYLAWELVQAAIVVALLPLWIVLAIYILIVRLFKWVMLQLKEVHINDAKHVYTEIFRPKR